MEQIQLRTAQKMFLEKAEESRQKGFTKGLLVFPTGLGKSLAAFSDMIKVEGKLLVLAHNESLLLQLAEDFKKISQRTIGFMDKNNKDFNADVIFGNVRTVKRVLSKFSKKHFSYIVVDETHHAAAKTYVTILNYFKANFLLGMTATPERADRREILSIYDNNTILEITEKYAIEKSWIRPYSIVALWDKWCDYNKIKCNRLYNGFYKYNIKEVGTRYLVQERIKGIIDILKNGIHANNFNFEGLGKLKGIYFCPRVIVAKQYCEEFNKAGIVSAYLESHTTSQQRQKIIKEFECGNIQLLFNVNLIGEGMHIKGVDLVIMDRPTESFVLWNQAKGRQIFNIEGSKYDREGLLIDFVGNSKNEFKKYTYNVQKDVKLNTSTKNEITTLIETSIGVKCTFQPEVISHFLQKKSSHRKILIEKVIALFKDIYGDTKPSRQQLCIENLSIYKHFLKYKLLDIYTINKHTCLKDAIAEFEKVYGDEKPTRMQLQKEHSTIYVHFYKNKLLNKYCKVLKHRTLEDAITEFKKIYVNTKPSQIELCLANKWIYNVFKSNNLVSTYCNVRKKLSIDETISEFKKIYGNSKVSKKKLFDEHRTMYALFAKYNVLDTYCINDRRVNRHLTDAIESFKKIYGTKKPTRKQLYREHQWIHSHFRKHHLLGQYCVYNSKYCKTINVQKYKPSIVVLPYKITHKGCKTFEYTGQKGYLKRAACLDKPIIRSNIAKCSKNNDIILALESSELSFVEELEKQHIMPKKLIIPNNQDIINLINALINKGYKILSNNNGVVELIKEHSFPIKVVNTSVLQYLVDADEKFDFVWLDYCGAFSYYIKDLDVLFQKHLNDMRLILTYNIFDPAKNDESYYFARVIDYVLEKTNGKSNIRLINDISKRYKKNMYNIGFEITNNGKTTNKNN